MGLHPSPSSKRSPPGSTAAEVSGNRAGAIQVELDPFDEMPAPSPVHPWAESAESFSVRPLEVTPEPAETPSGPISAPAPAPDRGPAPKTDEDRPAQIVDSRPEASPRRPTGRVRATGPQTGIHHPAFDRWVIRPAGMVFLLLGLMMMVWRPASFLLAIPLASVGALMIAHTNESMRNPWGRLR